MVVKYISDERKLKIIFEEEIDHHTCLKLAIMVDDSIKKFMPEVVRFDFLKVSFMDSSGIGMLLGRYRKIIRFGGKAEMVNLNQDLKRIFDMSGILKIIPLKEDLCSKECVENS